MRLQCAVPTSEKFTVKLSALYFRHDVIWQRCACSRTVKTFACCAATFGFGFVARQFLWSGSKLLQLDAVFEVFEIVCLKIVTIVII